MNTNISDILEQKKLLRQEIRKKRALLTEEEIQRESEKALLQLLKTKEYAMCDKIFTYVSYQQELSTFPLIQAALLDGKAVAVPKVTAKREMDFFEIKALSELAPGFSGILEPAGIRYKSSPKKDSLMILPGMLFDRTGKRLGYGGGFYDTYLEKCKKQGTMPILAGFLYDFQLFEEFKKSIALKQDIFCEEFPSEPHDQSVDMLITPAKVIYRKH